MRRTGCYLAGLVLIFCGVMSAQNASEEPALPQILGPQLIAWSELQKPQPIPQPVPPPERADQPSDQSQAAQPGDSQTSSSQPADSDTQQGHSRAQRFTGMVVRDGKEYMLKVSEGSAYQLDDPEKAKPYEGKQVKIAGRLDPKSNVIHVLSIELMS